MLEKFLETRPNSWHVFNKHFGTCKFQLSVCLERYLWFCWAVSALLVFKTKNLKLYIFLATVLFFFLNFQKRKKTMNLATLSFA